MHHATHLASIKTNLFPTSGWHRAHVGGCEEQEGRPLAHHPQQAAETGGAGPLLAGDGEDTKSFTCVFKDPVTLITYSLTKFVTVCTMSLPYELKFGKYTILTCVEKCKILVYAILL